MIALAAALTAVAGPASADIPLTPTPPDTASIGQSGTGSAGSGSAGSASGSVDTGGGSFQTAENLEGALPPSVNNAIGSILGWIASGSGGCWPGSPGHTCGL